MLYAFVVGVFVYREIKWKDLPAIMIRSSVVTAAVCFLLAAAAVIAWMLAAAQVPQAILANMQAMSAGPISFLILSAILFILLGAVLEGLPAVVILVPTFLPVVKQMNIDLIHYSIVVTAATGIGLFLPPIGVGLWDRWRVDRQGLTGNVALHLDAYVWCADSHYVSLADACSSKAVPPLMAAALGDLPELANLVLSPIGVRRHPHVKRRALYCLRRGGDPSETGRAP